MRRLIREAGLPEPIPQRVIEDRFGDNAAIADFAWPPQRVALFVHGREFHSTNRAHEKDYRQHAAAATVGWIVMPDLAKRRRRSARSAPLTPAVTE